jgi:hypothetical protein
MMTRQLQWHCRDDGRIEFSCIEQDQALPVAHWAQGPVQTVHGEAAKPGILVALVDTPGVELVEDDRLLLSPERVVAMEPWQLRALGLPPPPPPTLKLERNGLFTDREFSLGYTFGTPNGIAQEAVRLGAMVTVAGQQYTLSEPLLELTSAVDALMALTDRRFEARAPHLERIQRVLTVEGGAPGIAADRYLATTNVTSASKFAIRPRVDASGNVDFDVQPAVDGPAEGGQRPALFENRERGWNKYFRQLALKTCYPAGEGHYLVVSPTLLGALGVAKQKMAAPPEERREFVRNPRPFLKAALPDLSDTDIEDVFWESAEYSARVREIGLWQPRVLPFLKKSGIDWLPDEPMGLVVGGRQVDIRPDEAQQVADKLQEALAAGQSEINHGGERIPVTAEAIASAQELAEIARTFGIGTEPERPKEPKTVAPETGPLVLLIKDNLEDDGFSRNRIPRADVPELGTPTAVATSMLDFQVDGLRWLQRLWVAGAPGALLADDMGLGKTLQTLSFLAWLREHQRHRETSARPILTVAPTGLLKNWLAEHDKHLAAPGLGEVVEAHGEGLKDLKRGSGSGGELKAGVPTLDTDRLRAASWVLTTYETLRDYQHSFGAVNWDVLVLDEAQKIKNPQAQVTHAAQAMNAAFTVAVTGTPVENRLADLWTIIDAFEPGRLGTLKAFVGLYEPTGDGGPRDLNQLKDRLLEPPPPILQRRTKRTTLQGLPSITHHATRVPMPPVQADAYAAVVRRARSGAAGAMLQTLQDIRGVSLHPRIEMTASDEAFVADSARLSEAIRVLDAVAASGEKALVFVDARAMQAALMEVLQRRYGLPEPPLVINGDIPGGKRFERAETFQRQPGFGVLILSPRAGGVGLTITGANHVIHLGRWWNPAIEDQATDRVYRIGQQKPVRVYTPLAVHPDYGDASFDVRLDQLLQQKRSLSQELLAPPEASAHELEDLLKGVVGA